MVGLIGMLAICCLLAWAIHGSLASPEGLPTIKLEPDSMYPRKYVVSFLREDRWVRVDSPDGDGGSTPARVDGLPGARVAVRLYLAREAHYERTRKRETIIDP